MEPQPERRKSCLPIVERGCCCDLKICCIVQACLLIMLSSISIIGSIMQLSTIKSFCREFGGDGVYCFQNARACFGIFASMIHCVILIIFLVTVALFLEGMSQGKQEKMVHYIRFLWVLIVFSIVTTILAAALDSPMALFSFIPIGMVIYCLICANSLYVQMKANGNGLTDNSMKQMA